MIFFEHLWAIVSVGFMFFIMPIIIFSIQDYLGLFKKYDWYDEVDDIMLTVPIFILWWLFLIYFWYA